MKTWVLHVIEQLLVYHFQRNALVGQSGFDVSC